MTEEELQEMCHKTISSHVESVPYKGMKVGMEVSIIKDCTFVHDERMKLYLGHANTDVCIYLESDDLTSHLQETEFFKLYRNGDKAVRVPLVIIETKRGNSSGRVSTDTIRSRTIIAREINEIFPFCSYYFVADRAGAVSPGKIHRAGKHYDDFFLTAEKADTEWMNDVIVEQAVAPHLEKLAREGVISP